MGVNAKKGWRDLVVALNLNRTHALPRAASTDKKIQISHREDTPTFLPYSTTSTITFFFNQVFKWLPFHIKRYVGNEGSVSFSWIGIWLKAIASSFYVFLLPLLILSRSFSFTEFKRKSFYVSDICGNRFIIPQLYMTWGQCWFWFGTFQMKVFTTDICNYAFLIT